jgi:hypothetical protein
MTTATTTTARLVHVDGKQLLTALNRIGWVIPRAMPKPILQGVRLEASTGKLRLHGTDLDLWLIASIDAQGDLRPCIVPCAELIQRVKSAKDISCTLELQDDGKQLQINGSRVSHVLHTLDLDEYPHELHKNGDASELPGPSYFGFVGREICRPVNTLASYLVDACCIRDGCELSGKQAAAFTDVGAFARYVEQLTVKGDSPDDPAQDYVELCRAVFRHVSKEISPVPFAGLQFLKDKLQAKKATRESLRCHGQDCFNWATHRYAGENVCLQCGRQRAARDSRRWSPEKNRLDFLERELLDQVRNARRQLQGKVRTTPPPRERFNTLAFVPDAREARVCWSLLFGKRDFVHASQQKLFFVVRTTIRRLAKLSGMSYANTVAALGRLEDAGRIFRPYGVKKVAAI